MRLACILLLILNSCVIWAQINANPEELIGALIESMEGQDIEQGYYNEMVESLVDIYENPFDINYVSKKDLEKLVFLSDFQIEQIVDFIDKNGPISSKYQLQGIKGLSYGDIQRLLYFVYVGEADHANKVRHYLSGQVIFRDLVDVETAVGYKSLDENGSSYLGDKHHLYSKAQVNYGDRAFAGLVLDKDPGEKISGNGMMPADFTSGYIMLKGREWLSNLIIGDYHVNFGQGLGIWSGSNMGKGSEPLNIRKKGEGIKKYASANEEQFFRGAACSLNFNGVEFSLFASYNYRDGRVEYDSITNKSIATSLPGTGYHRTYSELETKNKISQAIAGGNLTYRWNNWSVSGGTYFQNIGVDSVEVTQLYEYLSYPKVKSNNYWFGYNYGSKKFYCYGELAFSAMTDVSFLNGILLKPTGNVSLSLLYRDYSINYHPDLGGAFAESSNSSGESGIYFGINVLPLKNLEFNMYTDIFKYDWLKYNVDKPGYGHDASVQCKYRISHGLEVYARYRVKEKLKNSLQDGGAEYPVENYNLKKIRLNTKMYFGGHWEFQFRVEEARYQENDAALSKGILSFVDINYKSTNNRLALWLRYAVFDTDDYNSRIYTYENDLLYNFSVPAFQDEGSRIYLQGRWQINKSIKFWLKFGQTWYANKSEIGSGLQALDSNTRTHVKTQVQIKF